MAHEIPEKWTITAMRDYVVERGATIESFSTLPTEQLEKLPPVERDEELRRAKRWGEILPWWLAMEERFDVELKTTAAAERDARVKRGRVRAADVRWDNAVGRLGAEVQLASGNNPKSPPYSTLFGTVTVRKAREFGAKKAGLWGRKTATKALAIDDAFAGAAQRVEVFSELIEIVGDERDDLAIAQAEAQVRKIKLHASLEELVARTDREITGFLPRTEAKAVVRELLSPNAGAKKKPAKKDDAASAEA